MIVIGAEILTRLMSAEIYDAKMVFNERGVILAPTSRQHRDLKSEGISYEDDYKGNALAAMVRRDAIEIRFHRDFRDAAVARLVGQLLTLPQFAVLTNPQVTYQGRTLSV